MVTYENRMKILTGGGLMYNILEKKSLNNDVDWMVIEAPLVAKNAQPGHFVILRVDEAGERIPLTIVEHTDDTITIIYQKLGFSTMKLGELVVGDCVHDLVGPLGRPTHIRDVTSIIAIAGGVGAAPLYPQLRAYKRKGVNIDLVLGARGKDHLILLDEYRSLCDEVHVCTDDRSYGSKGFVTVLLDRILSEKKFDHSIAIGPLIMMKNVVNLNASYGLATDVSLNPIMIDGTGMCGNCRVSIHGDTYFACVDGPDFPADGINFDELIVRQNYYREQEHVCSLGLKHK